MDPRRGRVIHQTLPSLFSSCPYRKGWGTKLGKKGVAWLLFIASLEKWEEEHHFEVPV